MQYLIHHFGNFKADPARTRFKEEQMILVSTTWDLILTLTPAPDPPVTRDPTMDDGHLKILTTYEDILSKDTRGSHAAQDPTREDNNTVARCPTREDGDTGAIFPTGREGDTTIRCPACRETTL